MRACSRGASADEAVRPAPSGLHWSKVAVYIMGDKVRRVVVVWH